MVVFALPDGILFSVVLKGIELVQGIEALVVLAVAALDLAVMAGRIDFSELVPDTLKSHTAFGLLSDCFRTKAGLFSD